MFVAGFGVRRFGPCSKTDAFDTLSMSSSSSSSPLLLGGPPGGPEGPGHPGLGGPGFEDQ